MAYRRVFKAVALLFLVAISHGVGGLRTCAGGGACR